MPLEASDGATASQIDCRCSQVVDGALGRVVLRCDGDAAVEMVRSADGFMAIQRSFSLVASISHATTNFKSKAFVGVSQMVFMRHLRKLLSRNWS